MTPRAAYDTISDWYEAYVSGAAAGFTARVQRLTAELLGTGAGPCLDVCCGTGAHAESLRALGWDPIGIDVSTGQLRYAAPRMPVGVGDGVALPVITASVPAAVCLLGHTDVDDYAAVVREIARVLAPGGRLIHIGVHPCFVGAFADWSDPARVVVDAGYHRTERRFDSWTPNGVRARVGAYHLPLPALVHTALDAGLRVTRMAESAPEARVPDLLGFVAVKPAS